MVTGSSGCGKTSLLSNWYLHNRDSTAAGPTVTAMYSVGANASGTADLLVMLDFLVTELASLLAACAGAQFTGQAAFAAPRKGSKKAQLAALLQDLQAKLTTLVGHHGKRVVLLLDAINQLADDADLEGVPEARCLPHR